MFDLARSSSCINIKQNKSFNIAKWKNNCKVTKEKRQARSQNYVGMAWSKIRRQWLNEGVKADPQS
jgi:hypothetical protein